MLLLLAAAGGGNPASTTGVGTAITSTLPDVVDGDTLMAFVVHSSASATIGDPAGWTRRQETATAADFTTYLFTRKWQSGDAAPAWTASVSVNWVVDIYAAQGVYNNSAQSVIAASNVTTNAVTPSVDDCIIVTHAAVDATGAARTWTCDKGTEVLDQANTEQHRQIVSHQLTGGSGVSQSYVHTVTDSAQDVAGIIVALGEPVEEPPTLFAAGALFAAASGTSITPVIPASCVADDVMVFEAMCNGATTFTVPTDWAEVPGSTLINSSDQSTRWFWKRHDGSESNPTSTTSATLSSTVGGYGRIYVYRGCITTEDPFEDVTMAGTPTSNSTPLSAAIDTVGTNRLAVCLVAVDDDMVGAVWTSGNPPALWAISGVLVISTTGGDCSMAGISRVMAAAGAVAAVTVGTMPASDFWRTMTFGLKPVPVAPPAGPEGQAVAEFGGTFSASGVPQTFGVAAASFGGTATASGVPRTSGGAAATFGFTATALGTQIERGQAVASFGYTATAAGRPRHRGQAVASFGYTATADGVIGEPPATGQAVADFGGTFTASGFRRRPGVATASFGGTFTASGAPRTQGGAAASFGYTATGSGRPRHVGQAVATFGFTATANGIRRPRGAAVATFGYTATALGVAGTPPVQGQAVATFGGTFTALGIDRAFGVAVASFGFTTTSSGHSRRSGTATATFGYVATTNGRPRVLGIATATFGYTAAVFIITYQVALVSTGTNRYSATTGTNRHTATSPNRRYSVEV